VIEEHDLETKVKKIKQLLGKGHPVKVVISSKRHNTSTTTPLQVG